MGDHFETSCVILMNGLPASMCKLVNLNAIVLTSVAKFNLLKLVLTFKYKVI